MLFRSNNLTHNGVSTIGYGEELGCVFRGFKTIVLVIINFLLIRNFDILTVFSLPSALEIRSTCSPLTPALEVVGGFLRLR